MNNIIQIKFNNKNLMKIIIKELFKNYYNQLMINKIIFYKIKIYKN